MPNIDKLEAETLSLIPLDLNCAEPLMEFAADDELWTWWLHTPPNTLERMKESIVLAVKQQAEGIRIPYVIYHKEDDKYIGSTSFWLDQGEDEIEIGSTWIAKPYHGGKINALTKSLMIDYAFKVLNKKRVILKTDALNLRSRSAIEKIGGQFLEIRKNHLTTWSGRVRDSAYYCIEKPLNK